ncbi:MAG: nitrous oxide reductase family maturation protein NosD [Promethearchaeota archaeon]
MRKFSKTKGIIIFLGISLAFSLISSVNLSMDLETYDVLDEIKIKNPKNSGGYSESFIHVDGSIPNNWSYTALNFEWCSGNGTWSNPYIIENITIDASSSPTGSGIYIANSKTDYFIIRNCTVYNAASAQQDAGIKLENTNNGTLVNNNCSNNGENGILLLLTCVNNTIYKNTVNNNNFGGIYLWADCSINILSENIASNYGTSYQDMGIILMNNCNSNTILRNNINGNTQIGIDLDSDCDSNKFIQNNITNSNRGVYIDTNDCNNNLFYRNNFTGNAINAEDLAFNQNNWDNGSIGNYWDDYEGIDVDDDGIGDSPYTFMVGQDNYPIWNDGPHIIIINSPNPGDVFGSMAPSFNVSINFPIFNTSWYTLDNGLTNYTFEGSYGIINQTEWDTLEEGFVSIKFYVNNTIGNFSCAEVTILKDLQVPVIEINSPINNFVFGELAPVYAISVEELNLDKNWYTIDGGKTNITFMKLSGIINQTLWDTIPNGYVTLRFYAIDQADNIGFEEVVVIKDVPYNLLYVDIIDQSFTSTEFIVTFTVQSEIGQGIINATFQIWWNDSDVSENVVKLGNGLYSVSLKPITVAPGDNPILLKMMVSAFGYEDKLFETYLAVDPEILGKQTGKRAEGVPLITITIIAVIITAAGIGLTSVAIIILRKKNRVGKVI